MKGGQKEANKLVEDRNEGGRLKRTSTKGVCMIEEMTKDIVPTNNSPEVCYQRAQEFNEEVIRLDVIANNPQAVVREAGCDLQSVRRGSEKGDRYVHPRY
jgi:hypothetical protein